MKLFDDIRRTRSDKRGSSEPKFSYLNESALPAQERIRILLEQWFAAYPSSHHNHLCASFRSLEARKHWGAFFELYCHALLISQKFGVEVEPMKGMTKGRSVDFLAYREKTPLFYMEATISIGDKAMEGSYAWLDGLCDALDNLVSPNFRLDVNVIKVPLKPSKTPSVKTFCEYVQTQLAERHPDEILAQMQAKGLPFIPLQKFQSNGWEIMIDMWAVSPARRQSASEGTLSSISYPAEWTYDTEIAPLFKKLDDEKRPSRYGDFDLPYIIAIDAVNTVNPTSIINTLIEQRSFEKHPKITAVLIANELVPRAIPRKTPVLWHNPFATYPLDQDIWLLPQRIQDMQKSQWNYRDGKKGWEIFQLYEEWPDEKLLTSN